MKKIIIYLIAFCALGCLACSEDKELGEIESLLPDYTLPQGKSSADDRVVKLHEQYGTYMLYEYTRLDFQYGLSSTYVNTLPDPQYTGDMLDLLENIWFSFYPKEFNEKYTPYKIFLSDSLWLKSSSTGKLTVKYAYASESSLALGFCSDVLREMSASMKQTYKNELNKQLWTTWMYYYIGFPDEFYKVSDYSIRSSSDKTSSNYARVMGFVANNGSEWSASSLSYGNKSTDLYTYLAGMVSRTTEEWASDLEYPLVKKKYDIVRNYIQEKFGFDIQKIGDTVYE